MVLFPKIQDKQLFGLESSAKTITEILGLVFFTRVEPIFASDLLLSFLNKL